jgi:DNA-binding MarR family transcriptional regulator
LFVLSKLGETGCSSLNELADRTFTHQSTVSTVVSKLVDQRLIAREAAPEDRRRLTLALTARGRRVLASAPDAAQDALIAAVAALAPAPRRLLGRTLGQLAGTLSDPGQRTRMFFDDQPDARTGRTRRPDRRDDDHRNDEASTSTRNTAATSTAAARRDASHTARGPAAAGSPNADGVGKSTGHTGSAAAATAGARARSARRTVRAGA